MVRIRDVKAVTIDIPLDYPIYMGGYHVSSREYTLVTIETDSGMTGIGFTFTRGGEVSRAVIKYLKPILMNADPLNTVLLFEQMTTSTRYIGRKGLLMRAISAVDIALWDVKGKVAGLPVYLLLGGHCDDVPAIIAGGYYSRGKTTDDLVEEMKRFSEQGYTILKIMVGGATPGEDAQRFHSIRKSLGSDVSIAVDVNGAWTNLKDALSFSHRIEEDRPAWIEEPFQPDNMPALTEFTHRIDDKVAVGEAESGRWPFRDILVNGAADILRPDATLVGGITEWLRIAHLAGAWDIPVIPHYFPYVHIHLVAGVPNAQAVEFVTMEGGISNFHRIISNPLQVCGGRVRVPQTPGLGIELNWEAIERFTIEVHS